MSADRDSDKGTQTRITGIHHLPVEVLHRILVYSRSSAFPLTSRHFHQASRSASVADKAQYILGRWFDSLVATLTKHQCRSKNPRHSACRDLVRCIATIDLTGKVTRFQTTHRLVEVLAEHRLDIPTFALEFGIGSVRVVQNTVALATASLPADLALSVLPHFGLPPFPPFDRCQVDAPVPSVPASTETRADSNLPDLPQRLFRHISSFGYLVHLSSTTTAASTRREPPDASSEPRPRKRRKRRKIEPADGVSSLPIATERKGVQEVGHSLDFPEWLAKLVSRLANPSWRNCESALNDRIGPVPSAQDLYTILYLLTIGSKEHSSYAGFALAMAAKGRAFALAHLLLIFGADANSHHSLAAKIAIGNGDRDLLHLLVIGPCVDDDLRQALHLTKQTQLPTPESYKRLKLDKAHLKLAIDHRQWELVDYIWREQNIFPELAWIPLIQRLQQS